MASKHDFHKVIIGRSELLKFVDAEIADVPAKTDTGAYRSSVHASNIVKQEGGVLSFDLLGGHPLCGSMSKTFKVEEYSKVTIANSFGHEEERYEVKLKVKLGSKIFRARFTLADRSKKVYPILLGREMLSHRFLVDSSKTSLDRSSLKVQYGIDFPSDEEEGRTT